MNTSPKLSPEVRDRAIQMVYEVRESHDRPEQSQISSFGSAINPFLVATGFLNMVFVRSRAGSAVLATRITTQGAGTLTIKELGVTPMLSGWQVQTSFVIRQQAKHPRLIQEGAWQEHVPVATGTVREQFIDVKGVTAGGVSS